MDIEQEIKNIKEEITNLKIRLCYNKMLRPEDFLTDTDKADLLNKRKYQCLICKKLKTPEEFDEYNDDKAIGICKECYNTNFPGNEMWI